VRQELPEEEDGSSEEGVDDVFFHGVWGVGGMGVWEFGGGRVFFCGQSAGAQ